MHWRDWNGKAWCTGGAERVRSLLPPKIHFNKLMSFTEQMSSRSMTAHSKVLDFSRVESEPEVSAHLGLTSTAPLLRVERLRLAGEEPFAVETCYLPAEEFAGLSRVPLERGSLFTILQQDYGVRLVYADEEVDATVADPMLAQLLAVPKGHPLLRIRQIMFSTKGKPAAYVLGFYPSDRHTLSIRRFR